MTSSETDPGQWWEVRVRGHLTGYWSDWFAGFALKPERDGTVLLSGFLVDQTALHGLLARIRDLGLPLISVNAAETPNGASGSPDAGGEEESRI